jgi:hypothetical protein
VKNFTAVCFIVLVFAISTSASPEIAVGRSSSFQSVRSSSTAGDDDNIFNLADFGSAGDGITDDGPALQAALNAIAAAGGGTLFVPAGRYAITTPVQKDFTGLTASLTILGVESLTPVPPPNSSGQTLAHGLDLSSEFAPRTGSQGIAIHLTDYKAF